MSNDFYKEKLRNMFTDGKTIIDIGGGLRILRDRGNWFSKNNAWIEPLLKNVEYKIMDPMDTYNPDIMGDIHKMPFTNESQDAIVCLSVLEHVEDPIRAAQELYRVLKPGGQLFVYVPFLYYYHAEKGYYGDFWRFTEDSLRVMFKNFSQFEIRRARGAIETWLKLSPLGRFNIILRFSRLLDKITGKDRSNQTSGFYVFLVK